VTEIGEKMKKSELGKIVAEFGPNWEKKNLRNSEGAFLTLEDGTILFAYSKFKGEFQEDWAFSDISIVSSKDGGKTFQEERVILTCEEEDAVNIMSLSFLKMKNGDIGLFYLVRTTYTLLQMFLRRSSDGGKTFGERILCTPQEGFFVVNNDRVLRLKSGRILIPAASARTGWEKQKDSGNLFFDSRSEVIFFCSDDDGYSWRCMEDKCSMASVSWCTSGLQEPGVIELSPGVLWGWARTDLGRQYEMFSINNGENWTACQPSRFTGPNSPLCMKRDENGDIYAVWNPIPEYNGRKRHPSIFTGGRTPLVLSISRDNGKTFSACRILEEDEDRGFCYCAIHFTPEAVLLAYCAGGSEDGSCLARTRIRRILRKELKDILDELEELEKLDNKISSL